MITEVHGIVIALTLALTVHCRAQCSATWRPGDGVPGAATHPESSVHVHAMRSWGVDPEQRLFIGGIFQIVGSRELEYLAQLSDGTFNPVGRGVNGPVNALNEYQGQLIAAGSFTTAGDVSASRIAAWDGVAWHALGLGLNGMAVNTNGAVTCLVEYQGHLVAGGGFTSAGEKSALQVARWDGSQWHPMSLTFPGFVWDLEVYRDELFAAVTLNVGPNQSIRRVIRKTEFGWDSIGGDFQFGPPKCLIEFDNALIAGGRFFAVGNRAANNVARWDGSTWRPMGNGFDRGVEEFVIHDAELYALGDLSFAGESPSGIAKWNRATQTWDSVGGGINATVVAAASFSGELHVGGGFRMAGETPVANLARWDGNDWRPIEYVGGGNGPIHSLRVHQNLLIAGGDFQQIGGVQARSIAKFNGASWTPMGSGVNGVVFCSAEHQQHIVIGGNFNVIGGLGRSIAMWDGVAWQPFGDGLPGFVLSIATYKGELFAGGRFSTLGNVAQWNLQSGTWESLAGGTDDDVMALAVYNGELIAAGSFATAGGQPISSVARWDGATWRPFPKAFGDAHATTTPWRLFVFNGDLLISGCASNGSAICGAGRWDPAAEMWIALVTDWNPLVNDFTVVNGELLASTFQFIGGHVVRLSGSSWEELAQPFEAQVRAIAGFDGRVAVGGDFITAGEEVSAYLATTVVPPRIDLNCDGVINIDDLVAIITNWGPCRPDAACTGDVDGNHQVDMDDLRQVILGWD